MQFIGMDIQEKLVRVGLISAVALYAALLVASAVRTVNDGVSERLILLCFLVRRSC